MSIYDKVIYSWVSLVSVVKNSPANAGDTGFNCELGRCPGEGNSSPLQFFAWEIP